MNRILLCMMMVTAFVSRGFASDGTGQAQDVSVFVKDGVAWQVCIGSDDKGDVKFVAWETIAQGREWKTLIAIGAVNPKNQKALLKLEDGTHLDLWKEPLIVHVSGGRIVQKASIAGRPLKKAALERHVNRHGYDVAKLAALAAAEPAPKKEKK